MDLGNLTIKNILVKKFGDDKAAKILSELQEGIDQKLPADKLRQKAIAAAKHGEELTVSSDIADITTGVASVSQAATVAI